jgi:hypothetical protein
MYTTPINNNQPAIPRNIGNPGANYIFIHLDMLLDCEENSSIFRWRDDRMSKADKNGPFKAAMRLLLIAVVFPSLWGQLARIYGV